MKYFELLLNYSVLGAQCYIFLTEPYMFDR